MTTPTQPAEGLPELPAPQVLIGSHSQPMYYTEHQMRAYAREAIAAAAQGVEAVAEPWGYYTLRDGKEEWHNWRNSTYFQWVLDRVRRGQESIADAFPKDAVLLYTTPPASVPVEKLRELAGAIRNDAVMDDDCSIRNGIADVIESLIQQENGNG